MSQQGFSSDLPAVFPDWSPYPDLDSAARAYLRDPDLALEALTSVLAGVGCSASPRAVRQRGERGLAGGRDLRRHRLLLWHGEDVAPGEGLPGHDLRRCGCCRSRWSARRDPAAVAAALGRHCPVDAVDTSCSAPSTTEPRPARTTCRCAGTRCASSNPRRGRQGADRPWRISPGSSPPGGPSAVIIPWVRAIPQRRHPIGAAGPAISTSSDARTTWMHSPGSPWRRR